jgi:WhiB family redox-sensing transcriptional regulator
MVRPLPPALDWRTFAVCRDADPEIFFPVGDPGDPFDPRNAEALAWCAVCPVRSECLTEALARVPDGVMGGMTAAQRRELLRYQLRRQAARLAGQRTPPPVRSPLAPDPGMTPRRARTRIQGIELLVEGRLSRREIARRLDVDTRTVERWAARPEVAPHLRTITTPSPGITRREARTMGARAVS